MTKGRKPTPNALKVLRGTDQPVRMREEVQANTVLSVDAKKIKALKSRRSRDIFTQKANQLIYLGLLTEMDFESLAIYATSLDMLFTCIEKLQEGYFERVVTDHGVMNVPNPYLKLYREQVEIVNRLGSDFGFSPVSRSKLAAPPKEDDQLASLMRQFE